jgi:hypothetical protein
MERIGLYGGAGLLVIGTAGMGLLEMALGSPAPVTGEGEVVQEALFSISLRSYILLLGLLLMASYGVSALATKPPEDTSI